MIDREENHPVDPERRDNSMYDEITGDPYLLAIEVAAPETDRSVRDMLLRYARLLNGEPIHHHTYDSEGGRLFVDGKKPDSAHVEIMKLVQMANIKNMSDYYEKRSLHLIPKKTDDESISHKLLVNVVAIEATPDSLVVHHQPGGVIETVDISRLGIDYTLEVI